MKSTIFVVLSAVSIVLIFAVSILLFQREGFAEISPIEEKNRYIVHREMLSPRENVAVFIVSEENIFVYYDKSALVNVYSRNGNYCYGIQISTMKSGHGDIAFQNDLLYIKSHGAAIALFYQDQFIEWVDPAYNREKYFSVQKIFNMEKSHSQNGLNYIFDQNANAILLKESQKAIVTFPQRSRLAEVLAVAGLLVICLSIRVYRKLV